MCKPLEGVFAEDRGFEESVVTTLSERGSELDLVIRPVPRHVVETVVVVLGRLRLRSAGRSLRLGLGLCFLGHFVTSLCVIGFAVEAALFRRSGPLLPLHYSTPSTAPRGWDGGSRPTCGAP